MRDIDEDDTGEDCRAQEDLEIEEDLGRRAGVSGGIGDGERDGRRRGTP